MKRSLWLNVLVVFVILCSMAPVSGEDPKPPEKTNELVDLGKGLYDQNCAVCHGLKGDAKTPSARSFSPAPSDFAEPLKNWPNTKGDPQKIFGVVTKGIPNSAMIGWSQLPEKERWGLVYYVMKFSIEK